MAEFPDDHLEAALRRRGAERVAGVDEAGRGALAGPVVAAAVVLPPNGVPKDINDSKRISPARRRRLAAEISRVSMVSAASGGVGEIDRLNILHAALLAMRMAVEGLPASPDHILIDGDRLPPGLNAPATAVIKGDAKSVSIAAASIIAKVERDRIMAGLAVKYPQFGWNRNAGYATAEHLAALRDFGPTPHHRGDFAPVREAASLRLQ